MATFTYYGKEGLLGGLNVTDNPLILGPAELTKAENISIAQSLARRKRPGQDAYHTSTYATTASWPVAGQPIRSISQYWRYVTSTGFFDDDLFLHSATKVWSIASRTSPAIDRTGALTIATSGVPSYQVFEGVLYFTSTQNSDGYNKWDGRSSAPGSATAATAPPDGTPRYLNVFRGRMVAAGVSQFPFRVYLSGPFNAELWTGITATSFDLDYDGDPEGVTALFGELEGRLYIATRRSIYELTVGDPSDVSTFFVRRVTRGVGCVGPRMFTATPNDILFWSDRGMHSLKKVIVSDQTEVTFLSKPVQKVLTDSINTSLFSQGQMVWDETQNLAITTLASAGQLTNDVVLVYNINFSLWTTWLGVNARSLSTVLINNKAYPLVGREDGKITFLNPNTKTDLGAGFSASFKTGKIFPGGQIDIEKRYKKITVLASSTSVSNIQVTLTIDGIDGTKQVTEGFQIGTNSALLGSTFVLGASRLGVGRFIPVTMTIEETGFNIQVEVIVTGNSDIEFYGFQLEVEGANEFFQ